MIEKSGSISRALATIAILGQPPSHFLGDYFGASRHAAQMVLRIAVVLFDRDSVSLSKAMCRSGGSTLAKASQSSV